MGKQNQKKKKSSAPTVTAQSQDLLECACLMDVSQASAEQDKLVYSTTV